MAQLKHIHYLSFKPLNLCVLVFQLCAELIGCHLLCLHNLHQVDVLLHKNLTLNDDVGVAEVKMTGLINEISEVGVYICLG